MGENGGRTTGQLLSYGPCACLAWRFMSLAHIHRVGTAGLTVTADGNGHCTESTKNKVANTLKDRPMSGTRRLSSVQLFGVYTVM